MRIVCQQTILMKYRALFVIFEKAAKFEIVVGGALRVNNNYDIANIFFSLSFSLTISKSNKNCRNASVVQLPGFINLGPADAITLCFRQRETQIGRLSYRD